MKVTVLGHAGLLVETRHGTVVCDPWFVPAFFGSWFVYPRNDRLPREVMAAIDAADHLYVSHRHGDHFDHAFLRDHVNRTANVLLPDFPTGELEAELRELGFTRFTRTTNGEPTDLDGLVVTILTETAIADGPQGDSAILIDDGTARLLDQNDCRPHDFAPISGNRPVDAHFLQYSGAIWYPMVYDMEPEAKRDLGVAKREAQLRRAQQYVRMVGARHVLPSAGPPAFLDPELFHLNDLDGDPANIFPDQRAFLERLRADGVDGIMNVPGTVLELSDGHAVVTQPPDHERAFTAKVAELTAYADDWRAWLQAEHESWAASRPDLVGRLAAWFEPLLDLCPHLRAGVGTGVVIRAGDTDVLIDFPTGQVRHWVGEPHGFEFELDRRLLETVIDRRPVDWSNAFFLSCRFRAWRAGDYNEYVYNFFKSLSPARMARAEAEAAASLSDRISETIEVDGYEIERYCPHRRADLAAFGSASDGVLTCELHGWRFDLATGACLTSSTGRTLRTTKLPDPRLS